jgi:hypothetical protein
VLSQRSTPEVAAPYRQRAKFSTAKGVTVDLCNEIRGRHRCERSVGSHLNIPRPSHDFVCGDGSSLLPDLGKEDTHGLNGVTSAPEHRETSRTPSVSLSSFATAVRSALAQTNGA